MRDNAITNFRKVLYVFGIIMVMFFGIFAVPSLIKRVTGKVYKKENSGISFEDMGPEIVKKGTEEEEK